jgi:hypothetical protein
MAKSLQKTTMAALTSILGKDRVLSRTRRSAGWLYHVCAGANPLTRSAAIVVAYETGVSFEWLMAGDPTQPPVDMRGMPYTLETFKNHTPPWKTSMVDIKYRFETAHTQLLASYEAAEDPEAFVFRLEKFASEMRQKLIK